MLGRCSTVQWAIVLRTYIYQNNLLPKSYLIPEDVEMNFLFLYKSNDFQLN